MYRLTSTPNVVVRIADGAVITVGELATEDSAAYQAWLAGGGVPEPVLQPTLPQRRDAVWERVKAERTRRQSGGVLVTGHWFQTDQNSRIQLMRLDMKASAALAGGGTTSDVLTVAGQPLQWKTWENGLVPMTVGLAQGIAAAVEILDALAFGRGEVLRQQIEASSNPEAIDITTGWPAIYGGAS